MMTRGATSARRAGERGSGTVLIMMVLLVLAVCGAIGAVATGYALAAHGARAAADMTALGAAQAMRTGGDPCAAAGVLARRNGVQLAACAVDGDPGDFVVSVRVSMQVDLHCPGLPTTLTTRAYAGVVPSS